MTYLEAVEVKPIIHWSLDGNSEDVMGHQDIFKVGGATFSDDGVRGSQALLFNQKDRDIVIASNDSSKEDFTILPYSQRTISFWFKASGSPVRPNKYQILILTGKAGAHSKGSFWILLRNQFLSAKLSLLTDSEIVEKKLKVPYRNEIWTHIAFRFHQGIITLFFNGVQVDQDSFKITQVGPFSKGTSLGGNLRHDNVAIHTYQGLLDEIKFFDIALSDENIQKLYQNQPIYQKVSHTSVPSQSMPSKSEVEPMNSSLDEIIIVSTQKLKSENASAFQPKPDDNPALTNFELEEEWKVAQTTHKSAQLMRLTMGIVVGILGCIVLAAACIIGYKATH